MSQEACLISDQYNCKYCKFAGTLCDGPGLVKKSPDSNVEKNREMLLQRSVLGLRKYGVTTSDNPLELRDWLQHALEEVLDMANYLQAAISKIDEGNKNGN